MLKIVEIYSLVSAYRRREPRRVTESWGGWDAVKTHQPAKSVTPPLKVTDETCGTKNTREKTFSGNIYQLIVTITRHCTTTPKENNRAQRDEHP